MFQRRVALFLLASIVMCGPMYADKPLTNDDVIKLANIGIGDDAVIAKVRQAGTVDFKLDTDDLVKLKNAGVSGKIIAAMLDRATKAAAPTPERPSSRESTASATPDQIEADLLSVGGVSASTAVGMVEFHFTGLDDFLDVQIVATREKSTIREYDVALVLSPKAVNSMSAMDAFAMMPGAKQKPPDRRPYRLLATIVYAKKGAEWQIANVNPTRMERVNGVPPARQPAPTYEPPTNAPSDAANRTGLGYRVKLDDVPVFDKPDGGKIKDHLTLGSYVANAQGNFLGIPTHYQPEERNGKTHVAYLRADIIMGWVESSALESFPYECSCEKANKECTAIEIGWKKRSWSDCFQRAVAATQTTQR